jgi:hypothetical protein
MSLVLQLVGSLLVLAGFAASQFGWLDAKSAAYLLVNAIGSGVLAVDAVYEAQWGFLLLEGAWAVVSVVGLVKLGRVGRSSSGSSRSGSM